MTVAVQTAEALREIQAEDRYFNCRPFFHVAGTTLSALKSLLAGACLVTLPTFEAGAALEMMERERCTLISGNDTLFQMLMGHADFPKRKLSLRASDHLPIVAEVGAPPRSR